MGRNDKVRLNGDTVLRQVVAKVNSETTTTGSRLSFPDPTGSAVFNSKHHASGGVCSMSRHSSGSERRRKKCPKLQSHHCRLDSLRKLKATGGGRQKVIFTSSKKDL